MGKKAEIGEDRRSNRTRQNNKRADRKQKKKTERATGLGRTTREPIEK